MRNKREKETKKKTETEAETGKDKKTIPLDYKYRKFMILFIAACTIAESVAAGIITGQQNERYVILVFIGIMYAVLFLATLEIARIQMEWLFEKLGDCRRIAMCYAIVCVMAVLFLYLPEFVRPVLLLSMGISMVASPAFGMLSGMFHCTLYILCGIGDVNILLCFLMLLVCGCFAASFLNKKEHFLWGIIFLFVFTFGSVQLFSYLYAGGLDTDLMIYALCNGILSAAGAAWLYKMISVKPKDSREQALKKILSEDFGLAREMKRFSSVDYEHAKKVSQISEKCARIVGANSYIAAAGGLYYRLGRLDGNPSVENGVTLARINYLPEEIIEILKEYNGEKKLPSTIESAIIHIVDSVVAKFDVLDKSTLSSTWNQDIIVYQTLNENSAAGLYDKSGLGMNMYLKIRDYLIKEAKLL